MRLPKPKAAFAIRPSPHARLRVLVLVFATRQAFRRWVWIINRRNRQAVRTRRLLACTMSPTTTSRRRHSSAVAVVAIPESELRMNTITHELAHATFYWFHHRFGDVLRTWQPAVSNMTPGCRRVADQERYATAHGNLCAAFVREARRLRLGL